MTTARQEVGASLVDHAVRTVRDHIRVRELKVGDTLPGEGKFAVDLGVSRAVMREAFGALAALGQIDVGNGRKARVAAINGSILATSLDHAMATAQVSTAEIWDVRRTLEIRTAGLAARNRSDEDARAVLGHAAAMAEASDDLARMTSHDIAFHQTIARASGNALFLQIVRSFEGLMLSAVPTAWHTRRTRDQREDMLALHGRLAQSIADQDPIAAGELMDAHFDKSIANLLNADSPPDFNKIR